MEEIKNTVTISNYEYEDLIRKSFALDLLLANLERKAYVSSELVRMMCEALGMIAPEEKENA